LNRLVHGVDRVNHLYSRNMKRVMVTTCSPMMQSLIEAALSNRNDVSLIAPEPADAGPGAADVDVVLAAAADPEHPGGVMDLLWRWPRSRVVVIATSGRDAVLYELAPRRQPLGDLSPATLVEAICGARA
jgi:hypothetical protein